VAAKGSLDHGVLTVQSMSGRLLGGEAQGRGKLDVNQDPSRVEVDLKLTGLELAQMRRKDGASAPGTPPPIEGALRARIMVSGRGNSIHQVAATANGIVTAVVPHGTVRDSLAELAGMDLRALGLLMSKDKHDTALRCAIAVFKDHDGTLTAQDIVADTEPVLITGSGQIQFDTESLDLSLQGEPKGLRLFHWRSPVLIKGTLAHPTIDIHARKLEIVDTGKAKDADCGSLIASADSEDVRPHASGPKRQPLPANQ
jgi:uncharacterized protein involved in outer membrane biogenesis